MIIPSTIRLNLKTVQCQWNMVVNTVSHTFVHSHQSLTVLYTLLFTLTSHLHCFTHFCSLSPVTNSSSHTFVHSHQSLTLLHTLLFTLTSHLHCFTHFCSLSPKKHYATSRLTFRFVTILVQSILSKPNPRRTAPIFRFSEVFGFPSVEFLVLCAWVFMHTYLRSHVSVHPIKRSEHLLHKSLKTAPFPMKSS